MTNILAQIRQRSMNVTVDDSIDIFTSTYKEKDKVFDVDPLLLSVSLKDLMDEMPGTFYSLDDPRVAEHVNDDIRQQTEQIRKYYTKKFFWTNFSDNGRISEFRSRMCYLLENRIQKCKDQDVGIYYKLPYFYEEDMIYDDFKKQYNTTDLPRVKPSKLFDKTFKENKTLKYVKTTSSRQRKRNINRFWFTDSTYLYCIEVANDNPLLEMFKQLVINKVEVTFETYYNVDRIDQMYFYKLFNFSLAKETNA